MICALCGHEVVPDGTIGYVHRNGSRYGDDGHLVVPVSRPRE